MTATPKMEILSEESGYNDEEHYLDVKLRLGNRYLSLRVHHADVHGGIDDIVRAVNSKLAEGG